MRSENSDLFKPWIGKKCLDIVRHENCWQFSFPPAGSVTVESIWRIVNNERVVLCSLDDGQGFCLPKDGDAAQKARDIIFDKTVQDVVVNESGDLIIVFENSVMLEILIYSCGYESWNAASWSESSKKNIIAIGGGELVIFEGGRA